MEFINNINTLTIPELIKIYIDEFDSSGDRKMMMKGERYYKVDNDIQDRKMLRYENGTWVNDEVKTNHRLAHGFMHNLVDDKVNYLLSKPWTLECKNVPYLAKVNKLLGKRFQNKVSKLGTETSNKGIAWLYCYVDVKGVFKTMRIRSEECIPLWVDNDHEELQAMIRHYDVEVYEGKTKKIITKVEYHTPEGVSYFLLADGTSGLVILDAEMYLDVADESNDILPHFTINNEPGAWDKVPFVPFKNNDFELPDLQFVKTIVDDYDLTRSDVSNMLTDIKNAVTKLKGYNGEDKEQFMKDMAYYQMILLDDDGDAEVMTSNINIDAAEKHWQADKKDIFDFGQGVDKNQDKIGNEASGVALKFMYSGLDLKCNPMEENFKWAFEQLLYFVDKYIEVTHDGVKVDEVEVVFNRDIAINESQTITDCQNSKGVISDATIISNHPWVDDVSKEQAQIKKETAAEEDSIIQQNAADTEANKNDVVNL